MFCGAPKRAPLRRAQPRFAKTRLKHASDVRKPSGKRAPTFLRLGISKLCRFERKRQKFSTKSYSLVNLHAEQQKTGRSINAQFFVVVPKYYSGLLGNYAMLSERTFIVKFALALVVTAGRRVEYSNNKTRPRGMGNVPAAAAGVFYYYDPL